MIVHAVRIFFVQAIVIGAALAGSTRYMCKQVLAIFKIKNPKKLIERKNQLLNKIGMHIDAHAMVQHGASPTIDRLTDI